MYAVWTARTCQVRIVRLHFIRYERLQRFVMVTTLWEMRHAALGGLTQLLQVERVSPKLRCRNNACGRPSSLLSISRV